MEVGTCVGPRGLMHGGASEGVTYESLCHHHLIPHQFKWEKSSVGRNRKRKKKKERKEKGKGKERKEKGEKKKERTTRFSSDRQCFNR